MNCQGAKRIQQALDNHTLVDDDIVVDLIKKEIQKHESENNCWVLEGFPRTKVQSLALQKMQVIPDRIICLQTSETDYTKPMTIMRELENHLKEACEPFGDHVYMCDTITESRDVVEAHLKLMFTKKIDLAQPRTAPRIAIVGPPGSGKTTQAKITAERFGLVCVSPMQLLKEEGERCPPVKRQVQDAIDAGEPIPEEILFRVIDARLRKSDCRAYGWVLDGFPETQS